MADECVAVVNNDNLICVEDTADSLASESDCSPNQIENGQTKKHSVENIRVWPILPKCKVTLEKLSLCVWQCGVSSENVDVPLYKCRRCMRWFHTRCLNLPQGQMRPPTGCPVLCPECLSELDALRILPTVTEEQQEFRQICVDSLATSLCVDGGQLARGLDWMFGTTSDHHKQRDVWLDGDGDGTTKHTKTLTKRQRAATNRNMTPKINGWRPVDAKEIRRHRQRVASDHCYYRLMKPPAHSAQLLVCQPHVDAAENDDASLSKSSTASSTSTSSSSSSNVAIETHTLPRKNLFFALRGVIRRKLRKQPKVTLPTDAKLTAPHLLIPRNCIRVNKVVDQLFEKDFLQPVQIFHLVLKNNDEIRTSPPYSENGNPLGECFVKQFNNKITLDIVKEEKESQFYFFRRPKKSGGDQTDNAASVTTEPNFKRQIQADGNKSSLKACVSESRTPCRSLNSVMVAELGEHLRQETKSVNASESITWFPHCNPDTQNAGITDSPNFEIAVPNSDNEIGVPLSDYWSPFHLVEASMNEH